MPAIIIEGMNSHQNNPLLHGSSGTQSPKVLTRMENARSGIATKEAVMHPQSPPGVPFPRYLLSDIDAY